MDKHILCRFGVHKDKPVAFDIVGLAVVDWVKCERCGRIKETTTLIPLGSSSRIINESEIPAHAERRV